MSAKVETMAYAGDVPWHGLGNKVSPTLSAEQMLKAAHLDWTVSKRQLYMESNKVHKPVPGSYALVRDTDERVLSTVGAGYKPVQNRDSIAFFKKFVDAGKMKMHTAGSLKGGQYIWALAELDADFKVGSKNTDQMKSYLLMMSPHVWSKSLLFQYTAVRVVCWNTLNLALGSSLAGNGSAFRMIHSTEFSDDVKATAEEALGLSVAQSKEFANIAAQLSGKRAKADDVEQFFCDVLRIADDEKTEIEQGERRVPRTLEKFQLALQFAPGAKLDTAKGTWWGAINAVTYVADHQLGRSRDAGLTSAWFGQAALMKKRAVELALEKSA